MFIFKRISSRGELSNAVQQNKTPLGLILQLGEVREATDADFVAALRLFDEDAGWKLVHERDGIKVFNMRIENSPVVLMKLRGRVDGVSASLAYDVLQDSEYRGTWDSLRKDAFPICNVGDSGEIGYYLMRFPRPLSNREFLTHRFWRTRPGEYIMMNHSVYHKKFPTRPDIVRGISYITGFLLRPQPGSTDTSGSCTVSYISQSDLAGNIPSWVLNKAYTYVAPSMVGKLQKAAVGYEEWKRSKSRYGPDFRPWLRPEQSFVPQLDRADVCASQAEVDEAHARNPTYADFGESVARLFRDGAQPQRGPLADTNKAGDNGLKREELQADVVDAELEREFAEAALQNGTKKRQNGEAEDGQFYDCQ